MEQSSYNQAELDIDYLSDALKKEKIHSCLISVNNEVVFQYFKNKKLEKKQQDNLF